VALYNDCIREEAVPPSKWRLSSITVLFKSGDPTLPSNYRPITILPLLYKLFSRLLRRRLTCILDTQQSIDQAGFRAGFSAEDHLFVLAMLQQKCEEFRSELWMAALDFKKAFDTVRHSTIWKALSEQHVPGGYVQLLRKLYAEQQGSVQTDATSKLFKIERGTKQGDPMSPIIFNAVLEHIIRPLKKKWAKEKRGVDLQHPTGTRLSNLRFADDLLLTAPSLPDLTAMLADLIPAAAACGLEMHPDKTKNSDKWFSQQESQTRIAPGGSRREDRNSAAKPDSQVSW